LKSSRSERERERERERELGAMRAMSISIGGKYIRDNYPLSSPDALSDAPAGIAAS